MNNALASYLAELGLLAAVVAPITLLRRRLSNQPGPAQVTLRTWPLDVLDAAGNAGPLGILLYAFCLVGAGFLLHPSGTGGGFAYGLAAAGAVACGLAATGLVALWQIPGRNFWSQLRPQAKLQRRLATLTLRGLGWMLAAVSALAAMASTWVTLHTVQSGAALTYGVHLSLAAFARMALISANRLKLPTAGELMTLDGRPPVLLLRAFTADYNRTMFNPAWNPSWMSAAYWTQARRLSFEEVIGPFAHEEWGPFVALGSPRDVVPAASGASRVYTTDATWRVRVSELAGQAQFVLVLLDGLTMNLGWELRFLRRELDPTRVFFLTRSMAPSEVAEHTEIFRELSMDVPPGLLANNAVIAFDRDWRGFLCFEGVMSAEVLAYALDKARLRARAGVEPDVGDGAAPRSDVAACVACNAEFERSRGFQSSSGLLCNRCHLLREE